MIRVYQQVGTSLGGIFAPVGELVLRCPQFFLELIERFGPRRRVNTDVYPYVPEGLEVYSNIRHGVIVWDKKVFSSPTKLVKFETHLLVRDVWAELKRRSVMSASVLDWLLEKPGQIPSAWKGKRVLFFGTLYASPTNSSLLYIRCLDCSGKTPSWSMVSFDDMLGIQTFVLAV